MINEHIKEKFFLLQKRDSSLIVVGGLAEYLNGIKDSYTDIDITTRNFELYTDFDNFILDTKETNAYCKNRRGFFKFEGYKVDVFENPEEEYEIKEGLKVATNESIIKYFRKLIETSPEVYISRLEEKLENLTKVINNY